MPRPRGIAALSIFFALGVVPSTASALALAFPGGWSAAMWRLKPEAPGQFAELGRLAIPLMIVVAAACVAAAVGLWTGREWGRRIAVALLGINLLGDSLNALIRRDRRTLIGLPIAAAMLAYLLSSRVRQWFSASDHETRYPDHGP